jgi:lysozyme family protein
LGEGLTVADLSQAFAFVMRHEDSTLSGVVETDNDGGKVRLGVNSKSHPRALSDGFYEMPLDQALVYAMDLFKYDYWSAVCGYTIPDQRSANQVADLAFNCGTHEAVKILQRAANYCLPTRSLILVDGEIGPRTLGAVIEVANRSPQELLAAIKQYGEQYYRDLARRKPADAKYLNAWLSRLDA